MTGMKRFSFLRGAAIFGIAFGGMASGFGQSSANTAYQLANVIEDVRLLDERLRLMNAELEEMRRENTNLRRQLSTSRSAVDASMNRFATIANLNLAVADAVRQLEKRDDLMKEEIVLEVSKKIGEFANKVNNAIGKLPAAAPKPKPGVLSKFHTNYPENGVYYKVKSGDNLSKIAAAHESTVDWIQNANTIADPSRLQVGRDLWIPVE